MTANHCNEMSANESRRAFKEQIDRKGLSNSKRKFIAGALLALLAALRYCVSISNSQILHMIYRSFFISPNIYNQTIDYFCVILYAIIVTWYLIPFGRKKIRCGELVANYCNYWHSWSGFWPLNWLIRFFFYFLFFFSPTTSNNEP